MAATHRILLINVATTVFMVGLIWVIQVVHYPLFDGIGTEGFTAYQQRHQSQITLVVAPVMLLELVSAMLLMVYPPPGVRKSWLLAGIALVVLIWLSTAFIQVPCHERLVTRFDAETYRWLVHSNWIRTAAWTARGLLMLGCIACVLQSVSASPNLGTGSKSS